MSELYTMFADVQLPKPEGMSPNHPFNDKKNHETLLCYLRERLTLGAQQRDANIGRLVRVDKHVAGWMRLSEEDRKRLANEDRDGIPQALKVNLPLTFVHLDDMMTYYLETFAPNRGMFYSLGKPNEVDAANQIVTIFNNNAIYTGFYTQTARAVYNILKYNEGGFFCEWSQETGPKLQQQGTQVVLGQEQIWAGNRTKALDNYNTFWDPSVEPSKVYCDGEFAARVEIISRHNLARKASEGLYYNCESVLKRSMDPMGSTKYYREPPAEAKLQNSDNTGTDWVRVLSMTDGYASKVGYELVEIHIKLNPYQMNLLPRNKDSRENRNRLEVWRFTILNDTWIIDTTYCNNMHGYLPYFMGVINDDLMGRSAKSPAEIIQPLSNFASFLMNTHISATRRNIWGLTVYDPTVVDLSNIPEGEVSARVAAKSSAAGRDIDKSIYESNRVLDTKQTLQDMNGVFDMLNMFYPTMSLPSQIAGIDRAITDQVAAVQQGANRRLHKGGRLLDDLLFRPLRFAMYYNVIQYQVDNVEVSDYYASKPTTINLQEVRQTDLPFIIGMGLKMLDRTKRAGDLQNLIFAMIQTPQTGARFDLPGLMSYWADMIDMDLNLKQFALQTTMDAQGNPVTTQEGGAAPIDPMTNPNAMTGPLVKPGVETPI